jgi:hypothetical protein
MKDLIEIRCDDCNGEGTTTGHVEPDGGFTQNEWAEMDYEFQEEYMAGKYDKRCLVCNGAGKLIREIHSHCVYWDCDNELPSHMNKESRASSPYCSTDCYWNDYNCNCGKFGCGWCT